MEERTRRERLRVTFDQNAELYDKARPVYPDQLFNDLDMVAGTGPGCRVLEVGCGTGQLTIPLAQRGCEIVALDLGSEMIRVARRNLEQYPGVQLHQIAFEDWGLPESPFDLVVSATAFHWLDPDIRVAKSAKALRPFGVLAVISTHHIAGGDDVFFEEVQSCYQKWYGSSSNALHLPLASEIIDDSEKFVRSGYFEPATFYRYEWEQSYSAVSYCELLLTYSDHRALPTQSRDGLMNCIADLIVTKFNGRIRKRYMTQLCALSRRQ